ncbi:MAG: hypothetical protein K1X53_09600 [Candidatus Sumerlaeaceae bacterium]|nr:hypothetical protein [Candidatus Sumerlaeaceae bacterium]
MIEAIIAAILDRGADAGIEVVASLKDPLHQAKLLGDAIHELYWKQKNLAAAVAVGKAVIKFGLQAAARVDQSDPKLAQELRGVVKGISYDIGSFTWPGWGEPGIEITKADLAAGREAAQINLQLGRELNRGDLPMSRAHWLAGAHLMSANKMGEAATEFKTAAKLARTAGSATDEWLNAGYAGLAMVLAQTENSEAWGELEEAKKQLRRLPEGEGFVAQLETALRVMRT